MMLRLIGNIRSTILNLEGVTMYIDPGTGSVLLQIILAAALSLGVVIRIFWKKIKALFSKNSNTTSAEDELLDPDKGENQ
jgi:uncharacterized protein HemX